MGYPQMAYYPQQPQPSLSQPQPTAKESLKALLAQREALTQPKPKVSDKPRTYTVLKGHMRVNTDFSEGRLNGNVMHYKEVGDAVNQADYLLCGLCESTRLFRSLQTLWKHRQDSCCFKAPNAPVSPEEDEDMETLADNARKDLEVMNIETLTSHYKQVVCKAIERSSRVDMIEAIITALTCPVTSPEPQQAPAEESAFSVFTRNRSLVLARTFPSMAPEDISIVVCREWQVASIERIPYSTVSTLRCSAATQTHRESSAASAQTDAVTHAEQIAVKKPTSAVKPVKVKSVPKPALAKPALRAQQKIQECGNCRACYPVVEAKKVWYCDKCRSKWLAKMTPLFSVGDAVWCEGIAEGHWPCIVSNLEISSPEDEEPYRVSYWWAGKKKIRSMSEERMMRWGASRPGIFPPVAVKWVTDQIMELSNSQETVDARGSVYISDFSPTARR